MKKIIITAAAVSMALAGSAFATGASQGFYVGANIGAAWNQLWSKSQANSIAVSGGATGTGKSDNALAWGVFGGYNFGLAPNWLVGGQVGFSGLGNTTYDFNAPGTGNFSQKYQMYAVNFLVTGTYSIQAGPGLFHIGPEAGVAIGFTNPSESGSGHHYNADTKTQAVFVLGGTAGYQWNQIDFFVRYDHYFGNNLSSSSNTSTKFPAINAVYGGLAYTF